MGNKNGLYLAVPTSVAKTGASSTATINTNGSVTFALCETLALNGVFTADYDNYMIVVNGKASTTQIPVFQLRASGTNATAANYTHQNITASGNVITGTRTASTTSWWFGYNAEDCFGTTQWIYGPYLAQPTAHRLVNVNSRLGSYVTHDCGTHSLSTSYDGFHLNTGGGTFGGLISVYGLRD